MTTTLLTRPDEIADDLTRRRLLIGGTALAALATGACGTAPGGGPDTGPVAGFPRTVEFDGGSAELARPPERIYTNGSTMALDNLLALGVLPALWSPLYTDSSVLPWQRTAGLIDIPTTELDPDVEQLAAERVDFAMLTTGEQYGGVVGQRIRELCPTVVQPEPASTPAMLALWGRILGREDQAADVLARFETALAALRVDDAPVTAIVTALDTGGAFVYQDLPAVDLLTGAGVPVLELPADTVDGPGAALAAENLGLLEPAEQIVATWIPAASQALENQPLFRNLPAVRAGRYRLLDEADTFALLSATALSIDRVQSVLDAIYA